MPTGALARAPIVTCMVQEFYFGEDLLLRRHDYRVNVAGGFAAAQLTSQYMDANGIRLPTRRRAYVRAPENQPTTDLLMSTSTFRISLSASGPRTPSLRRPARRQARAAGGDGLHAEHDGIGESGRLMTTSWLSNELRNEREPELKTDVRRVVHVLQILGHAERVQKVATHVPHAQRELILWTVQLVQLGRLARISALADVALQDEVGVLRPLIFVPRIRVGMICASCGAGCSAPA